QTFAGDERFCIGNINKSSFQEIWEGEKRSSQLQFMLNELNISECRKNCRMDEVNRYLWALKHPSSHVNFI
ncbi:MAG: radical SAM protein, partial [Gammaproteobacteria bacterium]|nr:radical SAM protein [Gammaproteobacteria bacterium]MBT4129267.1 radical SAM protein [Candidatus Neomarinimicrobiota bacterium]MBT6012659.1 radical SAM protein [Candidatus Neomarinimicrobiota bacterium]